MHCSAHVGDLHSPATQVDFWQWLGKRIQGDSYDIVIFPLLGVDDNRSAYFHALAIGVSALGLVKRLLSRALDIRLKAILMKLLSTQERLAGYHGKYD